MTHPAWTGEIDRNRRDGWTYVAAHRLITLEEARKYKSWCEANCFDDEWSYGRGDNGITFGFKSQYQAVLFKLFML